MNKNRLINDKIRELVSPELKIFQLEIANALIALNNIEGIIGFIAQEELMQQCGFTENEASIDLFEIA